MAAKPFASGHILAAADVNDLAGVYDRSTAAVDLVSSAAFTSLYAKNMGAGHMSTDRMIRVTVLGDYLNNTGSSQTLALGVTFGGSGWGDTTTASVPTDADRRPFRFDVSIANIASASVQILTGTFVLGQAAAGGLGGIGDIDSAAYSTVFGASLTANTAIAVTFEIAAQHGASNANLSIRKRYAMMELL